MSDPVPWLSVLMPVFNGARYVRQAVASVVEEGDARVEIVVSDDGSTDDTLATIEAEVAGRLPLTILRRPHDGNWVAGTNHALRASRGRHACVLHQDDAWQRGRLGAIREALGRPGAGRRLVTHDARFIDSSGRDLGRWTCPLPPGDSQPDAVLERLLVQNFLAMPSPTFDRAAALDAGGLDEDLWYAADWDLWLRLAGSDGVRHVPRGMAAFRVHGQAQTVARDRGADETRRQLSVVLDRHLPRWRAASGLRRDVERVARFSVDVNVGLAEALSRRRVPWALAGGLLRLGPAGWRRYLRDSRIVERLGARLRVQERLRRATG